MMRAKMRVTQVQSWPEQNPTQETLSFTAVGSNSYPSDGSSEDNTYAKWTPTADLKMCITNPVLIGKFKPDDVFYVDFTPYAK